MKGKKGKSGVRSYGKYHYHAENRWLKIIITYETMGNHNDSMHLFAIVSLRKALKCAPIIYLKSNVIAT